MLDGHITVCYYKTRTILRAAGSGSFLFGSIPARNFVPDFVIAAVCKSGYNRTRSSILDFYTGCASNQAEKEGTIERK